MNGNEFINREVIRGMMQKENAALHSAPEFYYGLGYPDAEAGWVWWPGIDPCTLYLVFGVNGRVRSWGVWRE